jgi:hypothetical protein
MAQPSLVGASSAIIAVLLGACSGSEGSRAEETGAGDSARLMAAKPAKRQVSMVMIGKGLGPGNRVMEPTFQFAPQDTVYLSVATEGSDGARTVTAAWRSQSGEILQQSSAPISPAGENTAFNLAQAKGLKPGTYKVVVFLGDDSVDAKVFAIKK